MTLYLPPTLFKISKTICNRQCLICNQNFEMFNLMVIELRDVILNYYKNKKRIELKPKLFFRM